MSNLPSIRPSVMKKRVFQALLCMIELGWGHRGLGVDQGWMTLPTRPQQYCDPASLVPTGSPSNKFITNAERDKSCIYDMYIIIIYCLHHSKNAFDKWSYWRGGFFSINMRIINWSHLQRILLNSWHPSISLDKTQISYWMTWKINGKVKNCMIPIG